VVDEPWVAGRSVRGSKGGVTRKVASRAGRQGVAGERRFEELSLTRKKGERFKRRGVGLFLVIENDAGGSFLINADLSRKVDILKGRGQSQD